MGVTIVGKLPKDTYGFNYKGKHSGRDFDLWLVASPIDFMVASRDALEERPWAAGQYDYGAVLSSRTIECNLVLRATSETDLRNKRRAIAAWLSPTKGLGELWFDTEPERYYYARRFGDDVNLNQIVRQGEFTVSFVAPDPYAYKRDEAPLFATTAGTYSIENVGTVESAPLIAFTGTNSGGKLSITYGGKTFEYTGPLSTTDEINIDVDDMTAVRKLSNGQTFNVLQYTNDVFPMCPIGTNSVVVTASGGMTLSAVVIYIRSRWE